VRSPDVVSVPWPAAPPLRRHVDGYLGYRVTGAPPGLHRGLPSRYLTCIVSIGDPIEVVAQPDPAYSPGSYGFVVSGLQSTPALIRRGGAEEGIAINLTPLGSRALLRLPAGALWANSVEATDVLGPAAVELQERLRGAPAWPERFAICDEVLGRCLIDARGAAPEVGEAWRLIVASGGTVPVADVAAEVGWSRRHLAKRFTDEFGLAPKVAARVVRFERACRMLQRPGRPAFAEVAAACGFYDQPHLNREFADLAGCSPGEWLATEIPSVQDDSMLDLARFSA
jgi:AraC-like DNA-binding protein